MHTVHPGLRLLNQIHISNVWLWSGEGKRALVDCGHPLSRPLLWLELWRAGLRKPGDLDAVILTHRHSDHAGNAHWLKRRFGCAVVADSRDAPFLDGRQAPPRLAGRGAPLHHELLCHIEDRFPARTPVDETFEAGQAWKWGFRAFPAEGHTEGSSLLYHEPSRTLFSGDVILTGMSFSRFYESMNIAVRGFSLDVERCHEQVRSFIRSMPPIETLAAGHGPAVRKDIPRKLQAFL